MTTIEGASRGLEDARALLDRGRWVGAAYLAGRAVESLLRSLLWLENREQEIGHDLRHLLKRVRSLGLLGSRDDELESYINDIAVVWHNNLRFVGDKRFRQDLVRSGRALRIRGRAVKGDLVKANALDVVNSCEAVIHRGALIWKRLKKS